MTERNSMGLSYSTVTHELPVLASIVKIIDLACLALLTIFTSILSYFQQDSLKTAAKFAYYCFLKPLGTNDGQKSRLEKFYEGQAVVYDQSRDKLLQGRQKMLRLLAAEINSRKSMSPGLIWVDVGGGTGWNIEKMHEFLPLHHFEAIYLVDLCEPLLEIARQRLTRFSNVVVINADATELFLPVEQVDVVTMSYSLSMIPPYFKVIDRILDLLRPSGLISVVDFFTSNKDDAGTGELNRQGNLINRLFWRSWFEFDHVDLNPARRDYLEHKFEVIKSVSARNQFVLPFAVSIPYYIYLGSKSEKLKQKSSTSSIDSSCSDVKQTDSPAALPPTPAATPILQLQKYSFRDEMPGIDMPAPHVSMSRPSGPEWTTHRRPYDPTNPDQAQFSDFIYSFVWEDPEEDVRRMKITSNDEMLVITSAGDNALDYLVNAGPTSIHCVDMNPCQGHLLELKIAAFKCLPYEDVWALFGEGKHANFPALLDELAPYLSSAAYQFWSHHETSFDSCFYKSGYAGKVVKTVEWLLWLTGTQPAARDMISAENFLDQGRAWGKLRKAFIRDTVGVLLLANPIFLWNGLGVPMNQLRMLLKEGSPLQYAIDTLDPVAEQTLLSKTNFHYLLPLLQHYTSECCPAYLKRSNYELLKNGMLLTALTLHTDTINNVLLGMSDRSLSKAVVMDSMDWCQPIAEDSPFPKAGSDLDTEIALFKRVLQSDGEVWWRSAAKQPWYAKRWSMAGFEVECISSRHDRDLLDAVNMYASLWRARLVVDA